MISRKTKGSLLLTVASALSACNGAEFAANSADQTNPKIVVDREFAAATMGAESLKVNPPYGQLTQRLALAELAPRVLVNHQIDRSVKVDAFVQGHDGAPATEEFDVSSLGKLDLLVVVDNSRSMEDEQENLSKRLEALTANLANSDWQIAVITTDSSRLRLDKVIKKGTTPAEIEQNSKDFKALVEAGTNGSGREAGLYYAYRAVEGKCESHSAVDERKCDGYLDPKWIRPDAALGVFIVSDERNFCAAGVNATDCVKEDTGAALAELMLSLKGGVKEKTRAYSLTWYPRATDDDCRSPSDESDGKEYRDFVELVGGLSGSICKNNFTNTLKKISEDVSRGLKREFELKFAPDVKSLSLTLDGAPFTDFDIVDKKVKLKMVDNTALKLAVNYRYDSKPKFDRFQLSIPAARETIDAFFDDQPVDDAKIMYDAATQEIYFVEMPPDAAKIKVKFRDGSMPLHAQFEMPEEMEGTPLSVTVDEIALASDQWSYDAVTNVVTIGAAPEDGAVVKISFKGKDGRVLSYDPASMQGELRHDVSAVDVATGEAVEVSLEGGKLWFDQNDVWTGRQVDVVYDFGNSADMNSVELAHDPLNGQVEVTALGPDGQDCVDRTTVEGRMVSFGCSADTMDEVRISYGYVVQTMNRFEVPEAPTGVGTHWAVFVDGASVPFEREGKLITVSPSLLKLDSKVRILVTKL